MRQLRLSVAVALALLIVVPTVRPRLYAQGLTTGLFDRYIDALRQELGIPGLSGVVLRDGNSIWQRGFGYADVSASIRATDITPYPLANVTETISAALTLQNCVERSAARLGDRVLRFDDNFPDTAATFRQVLGHLSAGDAYSYDPNRFGLLSTAIGECGQEDFPLLVASTVFDRIGMTDSVPGGDAVIAPNAAMFTASALDRYRRTLGNMAVPYRVGSNRTATRSSYSPPPLTASRGIISTVNDLAKFDAELDRGQFASRSTLETAWQAGSGRPTGLGWFVQGSGQDKLVWHFGVVKDAYSSLLVKMPERRLTMILLANSDGLGNGLSTSQPNATQSHFVRLFQQFFAP